MLEKPEKPLRGADGKPLSEGKRLRTHIVRKKVTSSTIKSTAWNVRTMQVAAIPMKADISIMNLKPPQKRMDSSSEEMSQSWNMNTIIGREKETAANITATFIVCGSTVNIPILFSHAQSTTMAQSTAWHFKLNSLASASIASRKSFSGLLSFIFLFFHCISEPELL